MSRYPTRILRTTIIPWWVRPLLWFKPSMTTRSDKIFGDGMEIRSKRLFGVTYILSAQQYR